MKITIKGREEQILSVYLHNILSLIENGCNYKWSILWFEGMGIYTGENYHDIINKINNSKNGYILSFDNLLKLSKSFDQIIEILVIGDKNINKLKRYKNDKEMILECEFCFELIDSSFWEINSNNNEFIGKLNKINQL